MGESFPNRFPGSGQQQQQNWNHPSTSDSFNELQFFESTQQLKNIIAALIGEVIRRRGKVDKRYYNFFSEFVPYYELISNVFPGDCT